MPMDRSVMAHQVSDDWSITLLQSVLFNHHLVFVSYFLAIFTFKVQWIFGNNMEISGYFLIVGNAFGVETFYNPNYLVRYFHHTFFHHLVILDDIQFCISGDQRYLVNFVVFKKQIGNFDDCLASHLFTFKIEPKGNLRFHFFEPQDGNNFKKAFRRDVINNSALINGTDFQF